MRRRGGGEAEQQGAIFACLFGSRPPAAAATTARGLLASVTWTGTLRSTHYWDCNGQGCDATLLQPWKTSRYSSPAGYQPQDPDDFGGPSQYGERLWMSGAASDALSELLGKDDGCCGRDWSEDGRLLGGCGRCVLVRNPTAVNADWRAIVMKKNRCPPTSNMCKVSHLDIAVPGFDHFDYSEANVCGMESRATTGGWSVQPTKRDESHASYALGDWYRRHSSTAAAAGECDALPEDFRRGCRLFAAWGWREGRPVPRLQAGRVPRRRVAHYSNLFGRSGPINACAAAAAAATAAAAAALAAATAAALAAAALALAAAAAVALAAAALAFAATAALATAALALAATAALATSGLALAAALCVERRPRAPLRQGVSRRGGGLAASTMATPPPVTMRTLSAATASTGDASTMAARARWRTTMTAPRCCRCRRPRRRRPRPRPHLHRRRRRRPRRRRPRPRRRHPRRRRPRPRRRRRSAARSADLSDRTQRADCHPTRPSPPSL